MGNHKLISGYTKSVINYARNAGYTMSRGYCFVNPHNGNRMYHIINPKQLVNYKRSELVWLYGSPIGIEKEARKNDIVIKLES